MKIIELLPEVEYYTHKETKKTVHHTEYKKIFEEELKNRWEKASDKEREERYDNDIAVLHCYMSDFDEFDDYYESDKYGNLLNV